MLLLLFFEYRLDYVVRNTFGLEHEVGLVDLQYPGHALENIKHRTPGVVRVRSCAMLLVLEMSSYHSRSTCMHNNQHAVLQ